MNEFEKIGGDGNLLAEFRIAYKLMVHRIIQVIQVQFSVRRLMCVCV